MFSLSNWHRNIRCVRAYYKLRLTKQDLRAKLFRSLVTIKILKCCDRLELLTDIWSNKYKKMDTLMFEATVTEL